MRAVSKEEPMTPCFARIHILLREGQGSMAEMAVICKGVQILHGSGSHSGIISKSFN